MGIKKIVGKEPFQVDSHSFGVSPSNEGYTLEYSIDGVNFTSYDEEIPANENLIVVNVAWGTYIRLSGNASEVTISC